MTDEPSNEGIDPEVEAFKRRQEEELRAFEERQKREFAEFRKLEQAELEEFERREGKPYTIRIDRAEYEVREHSLTGAQIRQLPQPPIGPDRDLFLVVPGGSDKKIEETETVKIRDGLRFFTAPAQINPGLVE